MDSKRKIFFQSSLPRAGSTLLQNILGQNPDFYVTPTSGVLELLYGARVNYTESPEFKAQDREQMKTAFMGFCQSGLLGFYANLTNKKYVVDKSRGWGVHYNFLNSFYPEPKIICMVRDLRDIYASMEKNFRKHQHRSFKIVNHAEMSGTSTAKRIDIWASGVPVGLALERLNQIILEGNDKKILFVKYEDLTSDPRREMARIYNYLCVKPYEGHDFQNVQQITVEDDEVYGEYGDHTIRSVVKRMPSDASKVLGIALCKAIRDKYRWFYDYFGYP